MVNSFDTDVALDVGINAAIIYRNIQYWCEKNRANEQNEYDGLFWTYNSISAFGKQFPYMSEKQIRTALKVLEDKQYIRSGIFNKAQYDRTKWYADIRDQKGKCICPAGQMDLPLGANGFVPEGEPIPDINTNIKTNNNMKERKKEKTFDEIMDSFEIIKENPEIKDVLIEFIKMRKRIKAPLTNRALILNINEAIRISGSDPVMMKAVIDQSIQNSYRGIFPLKSSTKQQNSSVNEFDQLLKMEGYT